MCGAHMGAGLGSVDEGLVLDLSELNGPSSIRAPGLVTLEVGALLGDLERAAA